MSDATTNETIEKPEVDLEDRRAVIEAAFEADEVARTEPVKETKPEATTPLEPKDGAETTGAAGVDPDPDAKLAERAPQSWKPTTRAQWDKLPPEVRKEVNRRELETTRVLNDSSNARKLAQEVEQAAQPFMARLQSLGATPVAAMAELLKADHILSSAPKAQKAQYMAKMIADYGVDIEDLDNALAGNVKQSMDPQVQINAQVERLLQERMQPYQQLLERERQREIAESQGLYATVEQMARDPRFPYFNDLRETMADVIDLAAKRGRQMSLEEAYNKAAMLDPEISGLVSKTQNVSRANSQAQRAKAASVSVGGAPSGLMSGSPAAGDRRAVIEAAFDAASNR